MDEDILTVLDIAQQLGVSSGAVNKRLERKGIKPFRYVGPAGLYRKADMEAIRDGGTRGRPKAASDGAPTPAPKNKAAPKAKPKKTPK
jgi:hypothetical protein